MLLGNPAAIPRGNSGVMWVTSFTLTVDVSAASVKSPGGNSRGISHLPGVSLSSPTVSPGRLPLRHGGSQRRTVNTGKRVLTARRRDPESPQLRGNRPQCEASAYEGVTGRALRFSRPVTVLLPRSAARCVYALSRHTRGGPINRPELAARGQDELAVIGAGVRQQELPLLEAGRRRRPGPARSPPRSAAPACGHRHHRQPHPGAAASGHATHTRTAPASSAGRGVFPLPQSHSTASP